MNPIDLTPALSLIVEAFDKLEIDYYIGGSVASSVYGIPRTTIDIDVVVDLNGSHVEPLCMMLEDSYYIDKDVFRRSLERSSSFNIIHFETMMKIDIFVLKKRSFDRVAFQRRKLDTLDPGEDSAKYYFSSPEDIILNKLEWYKMGGQVSERQWSDLIGVLKVQGRSLDMEYIKKWGEELEVADILDRALAEMKI